MVFESTILGFPLDSQTYIKALTSQMAQNDASTVRYLREQMLREVHRDDLYFI